MDRLRNLQQMATLACERFEQYDGEDFILPQKFKDNVKEINSNIITYNKYSAVIETRGTQHGVLNIYMPNQWFYVASYFTDLYNELQKYKSYALKVTTKERLKILNGNSITIPEQNAINRLSLDGNSKDNLVRFMTDYSWWNGAKTIDRGDFYVSPILSNAKLVNASQSFVADLCAFLANQQELVKAIIDKEEYDHRYTDIAIKYDGQYSQFQDYLTAIKSKPFLLLAGISGTGKSRIVRELAKACWDENSEEHGAHKPKNFEMIQVKPNWHDSSELIGYVSRVSGEPVFVAGDFLKFIAKAWENEDIPYFLCLDEMNLAPVEQYFAEYLSVIESRKAEESGRIITDPILKPEYEKDRNEQTGALVPKKWYSNLVDELLALCPTEKLFALKTQFEEKGITIPQNLIVIGTVNMDETTFSFSRKVLDRAMTIEMNEVDLYRGLEDRHENIGKLGKEQLIGTAVEGADVYRDNKEVCDKVLEYLSAVNNVLEGTPFKVAYRTRNEFLLYVVNNLPYNKDEDGNDLPQEYVIARALDEITSMKILSRIEGDDSKVSDNKLKTLSNVIEENLNKISDERKLEKSVSLLKIEEMRNRLSSGYTSFWS